MFAGILITILGLGTIADFKDCPCGTVITTYPGIYCQPCPEGWTSIGYDPRTIGLFHEPEFRGRQESTEDTSVEDVAETTGADVIGPPAGDPNVFHFESLQPAAPLDWDLRTELDALTARVKVLEDKFAAVWRNAEAPLRPDPVELCVNPYTGDLDICWKSGPLYRTEEVAWTKCSAPTPDEPQTGGFWCLGSDAQCREELNQKIRFDQDEMAKHGLYAMGGPCGPWLINGVVNDGDCGCAFGGFGLRSEQRDPIRIGQ